MNTNWIQVVIGAVFEVFWAIGLKHAYDFWTWTGTFIAIILSFYFMLKASSKLPVGSVYAVFVGLGTAGTVIVDFLFFGEPFSLVKVFLLLLLLVGVVGLKLLSGESEVEQVEEGETN